MEKNNNFYFRLNNAIRKSKAISDALPVLDKLLTAYVFCVYCSVLVFLLIKEEFSAVLYTLVLCGIGFVFVTSLRRAISRERPYFSQGYQPIISKGKNSFSMPSRHVYSVFVIALASFQIGFWFFAINIVCGILIALLRVIGGVHYISDVAVSALCALIFGAYFFIL